LRYSFDAAELSQYEKFARLMRTHPGAQHI